MSETSDYTRTMLDLFVERYDEDAQANGCGAYAFANLPEGVRKALTMAFIFSAEKIQEDMY